MQQPSPKIRWHMPAPEVFESAFLGRDRARREGPGVRAAFSDRMVRQRGMAAAFSKVGVPLVDGAQTAREHVIGLLKLAAEVEQALMVQYLYAANSISGSGGAADHRKTLVRIAIQEMGHLATVQNLLLLTGGVDALHMQRDLLRKSSGQNPIPFVLEPVRRESLAAYVVAEMPATVPDERKAYVDELVTVAEAAAGMDLHRVGAIYTVLKWMFLPEAEAMAWIDLPGMVGLDPGLHVRDQDLRPLDEVRRFEALSEEWGDARTDFILETPHTTADAVRAITMIAEQGEGWEQGAESHFQGFLDLVEGFDRGDIRVKALATSPHLGGGHGAEGGEAISHPYTRLWGEVFALQYGLLSLSIYRAMRTPRTDDAATAWRGALAGQALWGMNMIIGGEPATLFAALPLRAGEGGAVTPPQVPAGPPFDLDPALLMPGSDREMNDRHLAKLDALAGFYAEIEQAPEFGDHPAHANVLADLRDFDQTCRDLLLNTTDPIA